MAATTYFTRGTFDFLRDLARNNEREWFNNNKDLYERTVRDPALGFVQDFGRILEKISPHFRADPRVNGGSLFRIYRDVRFSKDKRPYKTHAGIQFRHEAGKDAHAPGFYLHLEPKGSFVGIGIWRPDGPTVRAIREAMVEDPAAWRKVTSAPAFKKRFQLSGDRLVRAPRGFDPQHPLVEDLKWKDFVATSPLTEKVVTSEGFIEEYGAFCRAGLPYVSFLCRALDLPV